MSECKFCNMTPITDKFGSYNKYENEIQLADGGWTALYIGVDEFGKICMRASGDVSIISDYISQEVNVLLNGCIIALSFYLLCGGLTGLILYALWGR